MNCLLQHVASCPLLVPRSRGATVDVLPASFTFLTLGGSVLSGDFKVDMNAYLSRKPALLSRCKSHVLAKKAGYSEAVHAIDRESVLL
jgi:hypothetical protein